MDGNSDDIKGLINFIRGEIILITMQIVIYLKKRKSITDIYHSEMVVVGAPSQATSSLSKNTNAYFKTLKIIMLLQKQTLEKSIICRC